MSIKIMNQTAMSQAVQDALNTEPDYSNTFTQEVMSLQRIICDKLAAPVEHDDDMNYSSAQRLVVWLDRECQLLAPRNSEATYRLIDFVSSRGRFFTVITLALSESTAGWKQKGLDKPGRYWSFVNKDNLPDGIKSVAAKIVSIMESNRFNLLEEAVLSQEAVGHCTTLDCRPATVFEVLFSEMY